MEWLKKRIAERSTWIGVMALAGICGYTIKPELQEQILTAISAVVAIIFTVTSDKKRVEVIPNVGIPAQSIPKLSVTSTEGRDTSIDKF